MYRKPKFLEELHAIREEMSRECDYDVDLFAEMVRSGQRRYNSNRRERGPLPGSRAANVVDDETRPGHSNE
jgi:hypothetical protein